MLFILYQIYIFQNFKSDFFYQKPYIPNHISNQAFKTYTYQVSLLLAYLLMTFIILLLP